MKKIAILITLLATCQTGLFAQVTTVPAEEINPEDSLKIIVDLSLLDQSLDHVQNLLSAQSNGEDMYIWTWNPYEFPAGHPKENGTGGSPWKNSNELLKMKHEGGMIYSYSMIPTEFYEVDAATCYANDIDFLVKAKDGGGYGDPDYKSEDLHVAIDPPVTEKKPVYCFPSELKQTDIFTLYYDNTREQKQSMQDLAPDDCYAYVECTLTDGTVLKIANFFLVGDEPKLQLENYTPGKFRLPMVPADFFELTAGQVIESMKFVVMRKVYIDANDRVDEDFSITLCTE